MTEKKARVVVCILTILFMIGYFGMFSVLANYIPKVVIYITILTIWLIVLRKELLRGVKLYSKEDFNDAITITVVLLIFTAILNFILNKISNNKISNFNDGFEITSLISGLLFSPIVEEIVCRYAFGMFFEHISKNNRVINIVSAAIFSFMHIFKMNINIGGIIYYSITYFAFGYVCGYFYRKKKNIVNAISIHFIWNFMMVCGVLIRLIM